MKLRVLLGTLAGYVLLIFCPIFAFGGSLQPLVLSEYQSSYLQGQVLPQIVKQLQSHPILSTGQYLTFPSSDNEEASALWKDLENRELAWHSFALGSGYHIWYSKLSFVKEFLENNISMNKIRRDALAKAAQAKADLMAKAAKEKARLEVEEKKKNLVAQVTAFEGMWVPYNQFPRFILKIKASSQNLMIFRCKPDLKLLKISVEKACDNNFEEFPEIFVFDETNGVFLLQGGTAPEARLELNAQYKILSLYVGKDEKRDFLLSSPERLLKLKKELESAEAEMRRQTQVVSGEWIFKNEKVLRISPLGDPDSKQVMVEECLSEPWLKDGKYCQPDSKEFLEPQVFSFNIESHRFENKNFKISFNISEAIELTLNNGDSSSFQFIKVTPQIKEELLSKKAADEEEKKRQLKGLDGFWLSQRPNEEASSLALRIIGGGNGIKKCKASYIQDDDREDYCDGPLRLTYNQAFQGFCILEQRGCKTGIRVLGDANPQLILIENPLTQGLLPDQKINGRIFYKVR